MALKRFGVGRRPLAFEQNTLPVGELVCNDMTVDVLTDTVVPAKELPSIIAGFTKYRAW